MRIAANQYPDVLDPDRVGSYPAVAGAGGGYVWDAVLEYRVWCHPEDGAPDEDDGNDYFYCFATYSEALECSQQTTTCCVGNARVCRVDSDCCSGQCLDGVCAAGEPNKACRQRGLPCSDQTDCCSGKCNVDTQRCVSADAGV